MVLEKVSRYPCLYKIHKNKLFFHILQFSSHPKRVEIAVDNTQDIYIVNIHPSTPTVLHTYQGMYCNLPVRLFVGNLEKFFSLFLDPPDFFPQFILDFLWIVLFRSIYFFEFSVFFFWHHKKVKNVLVIICAKYFGISPTW